MKLALFDFDGTITKKDTVIDFIIFSCGRFKSTLAAIVLLPVFFLFNLKVISHHRAKEIIFTFFYRNWKLEKLMGFIEQYSENRLHTLIRESALQRIEWHKNRGDRVVIVSGTMDILIKKWCQSRGIGLIATVLIIKDGKITGKLKSNCYSHEKVRRIKSEYDLNEFSYIYSYGDSPGDRPMLKLADESFYKYFN